MTSIIPYTPSFKEGLETLLEDSFVRAVVQKNLLQHEDCCLLLVEETKILGTALFTGKNKKTSFTLYIHPNHRRKGLGTLLLKALEDKMALEGVEEALCDFMVHPREEAFLTAHGYNYWFQSNYMTFSGPFPKSPPIHMISYEEAAYLDTHQVFAEAFHNMRTLVGIQSTLEAPSEEEKEYFAEEKDNLFLLKDQDELVSCGLISGQEIETLATHPSKQKRGYGRKLLEGLLYTMHQRGHDQVTLWAVEGNPAKIFYETMGFQVQRLHTLVQKRLMPPTLKKEMP